MTVYQYDGPMPPREGRTVAASLELACKRCGRAPRFDDAVLRALLHVANAQGGKLDLSRVT